MVAPPRSRIIFLRHRLVFLCDQMTSEEKKTSTDVFASMPLWFCAPCEDDPMDVSLSKDDQISVNWYVCYRYRYRLRYRYL